MQQPRPTPPPRQPFFARLLETQHPEASGSEVIGPPLHTLRYPSDEDEY